MEDAVDEVEAESLQRTLGYYVAAVAKALIRDDVSVEISEVEGHRLSSLLGDKLTFDVMACSDFHGQTPAATIQGALAWPRADTATAPYSSCRASRSWAWTPITALVGGR
ncbi:hypothetical protein P3T35_006409 [Kitasatospora sp. GP30]|uniref:hypothetical protein n=1 Tax=Kitasatospora sp. GP30 TaxID=3035084 RepID=UPI000C712F5F|nr:hypothetical protein [Kitasatospora sp. GP30]MDH6144367.1 hypothetical protein [Kitasatospora sp. GP30]